MSTLFTTDSVSENNYIKVNDGSSTQGWVRYNDGGASPEKPIDGTLGTPTISFESSTSTAIRGNANFLLSKTASVNEQGQGISYTCNINAADRGKVLRLNFEYLVNSGTYVDGALTVWFYNVTNSQLIQGAPTSILNSQLIERYQSEVQIPITCEQMRVIIHVSSGSTAAYTMRFDNFSFGPSEKLYSGIQTDWVAYTPTITGFGTPTGVQFFSRRNGQNLEINGRFTPSTVTATQAQITLGFAGSNGNVTAGTLTTLAVVGVGATARVQPDYVQIFATSGQNYLTMAPANGSISGFSPANGNTFSTAAIGFFASVPILGWSSSSQIVSDDYTGRTVAFFATRSFTTPLFPITTSLQIVTGYTSNIDTVGGLNASTGIYTAKTAGIYQFEAKAVSNIGAPTQLVGQFYKNGVATGYNFSTTSSANFPNLVGFITLELKAGDTVAFWLRNSQPGDSAGDIIFSGRKLDGPSQVLASETVAASYKNTAGTTISTANPVVPFAVKDFDTHNIYNPSTGIATIPVQGRWEIGAGIRVASTAFLANQAIIIHIDVNNGSRIIEVSANRHSASGTFFLETSGKKLLDLNQGDTIRIRVYSDPTTTLAVPVAPYEYNYFDIYKVK